MSSRDLHPTKLCDGSGPSSRVTTSERQVVWSWVLQFVVFDAVCEAGGQILHFEQPTIQSASGLVGV